MAASACCSGKSRPEGGLRKRSPLFEESSRRQRAPSIARELVLRWSPGLLTLSVSVSLSLCLSQPLIALCLRLRFSVPSGFGGMGNSSSGHPWNMEVEGGRSRADDAGASASYPSTSSASCVSSMEKTVLLHDWWLIKVRDVCNRGTLAVGGLTATGKAARIFNSAPIAKRYDAYTLETKDGITVRIQGLINITRTNHNGFPLEACNNFRIGFPYNWKVYADKYFGANANTSVNEDGSLDIPTRKIIECLNLICEDMLARKRGIDGDNNTHKNSGENVPLKDGEDVRSRATPLEGLAQSPCNVRNARENTSEAADAIQIPLKQSVSACSFADTFTVPQNNTKGSTGCGSSPPVSSGKQKLETFAMSGEARKDITGGCHLSKSPPPISQEFARDSPQGGQLNKEAPFEVDAPPIESTSLPPRYDDEQTGTRTINMNSDRGGQIEVNTDNAGKLDGLSQNRPVRRTPEVSNSVLFSGSMMTPGKKCPRKQLLFADEETRNSGKASLVTESQEDVDLNRVSFGFEGLSTESPSNTDAPSDCATSLHEVNDTPSPHLAGSTTQAPDSRVSLRRSRRLRKTTEPVMSDKPVSVEPGEMDTDGSPSRVNEQSNTGRGETDVPSVEGQNLVFSTPRIEKTLTTPTFSKQREVQNLRRNPPRTKQKDSNVHKAKEPAIDLAKDDVFSFRVADDCASSANVSRSPNHLSKARNKAAARKKSSSVHVFPHAGDDVHGPDSTADLRHRKKISIVKTPKSVGKVPSALKRGESMLPKKETTKLSFASPELLNLKRSKSGRVLVPKLSNWCQQILYENGSIAGILTGVDAIASGHPGSRSEPSKKRNKIL